MGKHHLNACACASPCSMFLSRLILCSLKYFFFCECMCVRLPVQHCRSRMFYFRRRQSKSCLSLVLLLIFLSSQLEYIFFLPFSTLSVFFCLVSLFSSFFFVSLTCVVSKNFALSAFDSLDFLSPRLPLSILRTCPSSLTYSLSLSLLSDLILT